MDSVSEAWVVVPFNRNYEVSNLGRIRAAVTRRGVSAGKILRPRKSGDGYFKVAMHKDLKRRNIGIHRVVAESFIGPPPSKLHEVNHINCNSEDNRASNLEWVTHRDNMRHAYRNGRVTIPTIGGGEKVGNHKLLTEEVREIRGRLSRGDAARRIAVDFGVTRGTIDQIRDGKTWASVS